MLIQAFRFGTFSKINEFVNFRDKVRYSIQRCISKRQAIRSELFGQFNDINLFCNYLDSLDYDSLKPLGELLLKIDYDYVSDNRDKTLFQTYKGEKTDLFSMIRGSTFPKCRVIFFFSLD
jgi:N-terminal acetyltransferase B complex non-catalytic subunit